MLEYAEQMQAPDADFANIIRKSGSTVGFNSLAVRATALPSDIAAQLDSIPVGTQKGPFLTAADNTQNIVRVLGKTSLPDSVQFRQIAVSGATEADAQKTADSIMTALNAGVPFDSIARKYNQTGEETWLTSAQYENAVLDESNQKFVSQLSTQAAGTTAQLKLGNAVAIIRVLDRKHFVDKYNVAVVKRPIDFSNDTFNKTYNDFSQFVATYKTIEEIEANAVKSGYMVQERQGLFSTEHNVAGLSSTREAFRWIFNVDSKVAAASDIYTVGNNDHLLLVMLTAKNNEQYRTLESVKEYLQSEIERDKKAAMLQEKMEACNDLAAVAKLQGALPVDTIKHVTFNAPVFLQSVGSSEPALSGAIAKAAKGQFVKGIKGNAGIFAFQVTGEENANAELDDISKQNTKVQIINQGIRASSRYIAELMEKANVKDNRYIFY